MTPAVAEPVVAGASRVTVQAALTHPNSTQQPHIFPNTSHIARLNTGPYAPVTEGQSTIVCNTPRTRVGWVQVVVQEASQMVQPRHGPLTRDARAWAQGAGAQQANRQLPRCRVLPRHLCTRMHRVNGD